MQTLSPKALRHAADLQERIDRLQAELAQILGSVQFAVAPTGKIKAEKKKRHGMSPAAKAKISKAAKKRWAAVHAAGKTSLAQLKEAPVAKKSSVAKKSAAVKKSAANKKAPAKPKLPATPKTAAPE